MRKLTTSLTFMALALAWCAPARADDKEVRATIEKAIKAHGGADNLNKYLAMTCQLKGKVSVMEMNLDFTGDLSTQIPDKFKIIVNVEVAGMAFKTTQVFNKDKAWLKLNDMEIELDKETLAEAKEELHSQLVTGQLTPLLGKEYKLSSLGEVKVNDKPAIGIQVTRKGFKDLNLYFDKKTHLLAKTERRALDQQTKQEVTEEGFQDDYKEVSGVMVPHKFKIKRDGKDYMEAEMSDTKILEKLSDDTFAKP